MDDFVTLLSDNFFIVVVGACLIVAMALRAVTTIVTTNARERSRREIAAYIAEGSISPDQGERIIKAEVDSGRSCGA